MNKFKYYFNLIRELSWVDFKLKYYGSWLGMLWSFLKPFLMLTILYIVFFYFLRINIENYPFYLLLGIIIWNFFADTTKESAQNALSKIPLFQTTKLPPFAAVVSTIIHSFWTFLITLAVFFIFLFVFGITLSWSAVILPFIVVLLFILTAGVSLLITPLYMRFKDFGHIWDIFLQMLFWATPIVYQYKLVPVKYIKWFLLIRLAG